MSKAVAVATGDEEEEEGCRLWAVAVPRWRFQIWERKRKPVPFRVWYLFFEMRRNSGRLGR